LSLNLKINTLQERETEQVTVWKRTYAFQLFYSESKDQQINYLAAELTRYHRRIISPLAASGGELNPK
jgi:hypothetical protein